MDPYRQMQKELMELWTSLNSSSGALLPKNVKAIKRRLSTICHLAEQMSGQVQIDTEQLKRDIGLYLSGELEAFEINQMLKHVLKLEQDTREL